MNDVIDAYATGFSVTRLAAGRHIERLARISLGENATLADQTTMVTKAGNRDRIDPVRHFDLARSNAADACTRYGPRPILRVSQ